MTLTGKDIAEIARLLDDSQFASLDLEMGDFRLRIRRDGGGWAPVAIDEPGGEIEAAPAATPAPEPGMAPDGGVPQTSAVAGEVDVPAPLLGNFYSAPRPGEDPYVSVGDSVGEDTTIGIIEVMKLMNPIRAGVSGTVTAILAENGKAVEQGQPLIRVKAD